MTQAVDSRNEPARADVLKEVAACLAKLLPKRKARNIELTTHLFRDLGMDSIQLLEFLFALETRFATSLSEAELKKQRVESVGDVVDLIARLMESGKVQLKGLAAR